MSDSILQSLLDRSAVHDVIVRIALAQDQRNWEAVAACFEADAVYIHPGGRIDGVDGIVDRARAALAPLDACQHLMGSILVTCDGDTATSVSYFQAQHVRHDAEGGNLFTIAGTYTDRVARRDGEWRIAERRQTYAWRAGNPDVIVRTHDS